MRMLRKGWFRWTKGERWRRAVVDDLGFVFFPGCHGWFRPADHSDVRLLPSAPSPFSIWHEEWWTPKAWCNAAWAWIYSA